MSQISLKSKKIEDLFFNYNSESIITFIGQGNIPFFKGCHIPKDKLIELLNFVIEKSESPFCVTYCACYAMDEVYITHSIPQKTHYWFNTQSSLNAKSVSITIQDNLVTKFDHYALLCGTSRSSLIHVFMAMYFSSDLFLEQPSENFFENVRHLKDIDVGVMVGNDAVDDSDAVDDAQFEPSNLSWTELEEELKGMLSVKQYSAKSTHKLLNTLKEKMVKRSKDLLKLKSTQYTIKGMSITGKELVCDQVPSSFLIRQLETLFANNLDHYKGVYSLEVYDPFYDLTFNFYPILMAENSNEDMTNIGLFLRPFIKFWYNKYSANSNRTRRSLFRQAFHGFEKDIDQQWLDFTNKHGEKGVAQLVDGVKQFENIPVVGRNVFI